MRASLGPLAVPALRQLALVIGVSALGIAMAYTSIAAIASGQGAPSAAGYIEAGIALGAATGGLLWGRRKHTRRRSTHLAGLVAVGALGLLAATMVSGNLFGLDAVMAVTGLGIAPLLAVVAGVTYLAARALDAGPAATPAETASERQSDPSGR